MKNDEAILELRNLISDDNADRENEALLHAIETIRYVNEKVKAADDVIKAFKRPHGKWIYKQVYDYEYWECSNCGEPWTTIEGTPKDNNMKFCPNCGADMRGKEE